MYRVVLDTNQFVSALLSRQGPSARLLRAWQEHAYVLVTSPALLGEIERVLSYPRLIKKYALTPEDRSMVLQLLRQEAVVIPNPEVVAVIRDDPDDDQVLACAAAAKAQYVVSSDQHVLTLGRYRGIEMVTAREFLEVLDVAG